MEFRRNRKKLPLDGIIEKKCGGYNSICGFFDRLVEIKGIVKSLQNSSENLLQI